MKKGRFLWSAHRITEKQKAGKARNIKEKQLKNSRNTVSKLPVVRLSSPRDNLYPLWELTKRLFMRFVALCVCLETGKSQTATNIKLTSN